MPPFTKNERTKRVQLKEFHNHALLLQKSLVIVFNCATSGNHTPGSRSYSLWIPRQTVCIHQLVLKPCSKSASTVATKLAVQAAIRVCPGIHAEVRV